MLADSLTPPSAEVDLLAAAPPAWVDAKAVARSRRANAARQASGRRRGVDPTTTDRSYSTSELEFLQAIEEYKHSSGRMFPTWSEALGVLQGLGYHR